MPGRNVLLKGGLGVGDGYKAGLGAQLDDCPKADLDLVNLSKTDLNSRLSQQSLKEYYLES